MAVLDLLPEMLEQRDATQLYCKQDTHWSPAACALAAKRRGQARAWLWREVGDGLMAALKADGGETGRIEAEVAAGRMTPEAGARTLIRGFLARSGRGRQEP